MSGDVPRRLAVHHQRGERPHRAAAVRPRGGALRGRLPPGPARARTRPGQSRARLAGSPSPGQPSKPACGPSSASPSRWERSVSGRSTSTATGRGRSPTTSTPTRWSWPTLPPRPSWSCRRTRPPGRLAAELEAGADFHYVVHQASGMVAAQLGVSVGQALIRLRAYAFGNDRPLTEVAKDVVAQDAALRCRQR